MYYAICYAYGARVVNNGNRADEIMYFSEQRLRDAWVQRGPASFTESGYRESIAANDPRVLGTEIDSALDDHAGWHALALNRLERDADLNRDKFLIVNPDAHMEPLDHLQWVVTASATELKNFIVTNYG